MLIDLVGSGSSDPEARDAEKYSSLSGYAGDILEIVDELDLADVLRVRSAHSGVSADDWRAGCDRKYPESVRLTSSLPRHLRRATSMTPSIAAALLKSRIIARTAPESLEQNYLGWSKAIWRRSSLGTRTGPSYKTNWPETFRRPLTQNMRGC